MVALAELGVAVVVVLAVVVAYRVLKAVTPFVVNAVVGLVVFALAGFLGFGVQITPLVVLIVALGGLPAALLVIVLARLGVVFSPAVLGF